MSLYSGISFGGEIPTVVEPPTSTTDSTSTSSISTTFETTTEAEKAKPAVWSAALRFAPTIRKKIVSSQSSHSIPLSLQSAFNNSEDSNVNKGPRIVAPAKSALSIPTIKAEPSLYSTSSNSTASTSTISPSTSTATTSTATAPIRSGRILQAPSMTLDEEDVNGFLQTAKGKRVAGKQQGKGNKRRNNKGGGGVDIQLGFDDTSYEPSKPCDYSAYKAHLQAQRTQRRLVREEERRRERSPSGSSYYSSDEKSGDEQQSSKKARLFAPPTSYDSPPSQSNEDLPMLTPATFTSAEISQPNVNAAPRAETGEEAYLRRVALSSGGPPKPSAPPVQQQQPQSQYPTFTSSSISAGPTFTGYVPPPSFNIPTSSPYNLQLPPPPPPNFTPPPTTFGPFIPSDGSFPPFRPPPPTENNLDGTPSVLLSDAAMRARDIAQRLGKLAGMQPPPSSSAPSQASTSVTSSIPSEPDNRPFAERLMSKFGWKEGQGLGAEESGITTALSVSKVPVAPHPNSKKAKKAAAEGPPPAPVSAMSNVRIIDAARSGRNAQQVAEIGEPSRVVLLTNLCGRNDVDDDLGGEIAEEAEKFGVVDRCFVYLVPGETRDDEAVRIFLVMSGLAGGYNAVRNFGGRFFGGRVVKARFYDEMSFNAGEHRL